MNRDKEEFAKDVIMTAGMLEYQYWQAKKLMQRLNAKAFNEGAANEFTPQFVDDGQGGTTEAATWDLPGEADSSLGHITTTQLYAAINAASAFITAMESAGNLGALTAVGTGTIKAR